MSYAAVGGPNQVVSASWSPRWVQSPTRATYPSGRINPAVGTMTAPRTKRPGIDVCGIDLLNPIRPRSDVEAARLTEVEKQWAGMVQQGEDP